MPRDDKVTQQVRNKLQSLDFSYSWDSYASVEEVGQVLSRASKGGTGHSGFPDHVYVNPTLKLLILVEDKNSISEHRSAEGDDPVHFAVDGILHYLKFFRLSFLEDCDLARFFSSWHIVGVAFSGAIDDPYNHLVSTYCINGDEIVEEKDVREFVAERDYLKLFSNLALDDIVVQVSRSSRLINKLLRSVDSQKRPILLSALMICLYQTKKRPNDFITSYPGYSAPTIVANIVPTLRLVLEEENIPKEKVDVIVNELAFLETDRDLNDSKQCILKDILNELDRAVIPLFSQEHDYDIVGKFYEEFLRFAGVANVKKGIVLTPRHITGLFAKLIDLKYNDVIVDFACGTGAFLIAAMNRLINLIDDSEIPEKRAMREAVKTRQLVGFEKNATMYACALSNMMFHGDGKSNIAHCDCFSAEADSFLESLEQRGIKPTIGFINPPYGGKDNRENPTKKEIQFLVKMLDSVSRYGVIIAPLSMYLKDDSIRQHILQRHTLKCVINMPVDLFMPNAATQTAIAVFETCKPHGSQKVAFTKLDDDGFALAKGRGRVDAFGRWDDIERQLLMHLSSPEQSDDGTSFVYSEIPEKGEWLLQAYAAIDYKALTTESFEENIKQRLSYVARRDMGVLHTSIDAVTCSEILSEYYDVKFSRHDSMPVETCTWRPFKIADLFLRHNGVRLTKADMTNGATNYLGAIQGDNGVREQIGEDPLFQGGTITVNYNGSVGEAFYQSEPYWPSDDVYTLELRRECGTDLDVVLAMFLVTMIKLHRQNYFYGRKWSSAKMESSEILLPVDESGSPDWSFMRDFIMRLPYAALLR